jgi:integrase
MKLAKLTALDVSSLLGGLLTSGYRKGKTPRGLSPTSVRYVHRIMSHALSDAVRWGLLVRNPADQVDAPRKAETEMPTWSADEVRTFLDSVATDRLWAMWVLLCTTGMRRGEVLGLRWDDVDLAAGRIAVRRALVEVDGYDLHISEPKTARGRRSVKLDTRTVAALTYHRRWQMEERLAEGIGGRPELLFTKPDGEPLQPQHVSQAFEARQRRAGLPIIRLHDLRHTAATIALSAGIHPKIVSERLGHSTVQLTLDRYSHVVDGLQEAAAQQIGDAIFGEDPPNTASSP